MGKLPIPTLLTGALLVGILVLYMITFQVRFSEAVVKTRFGSADETSVIREPGLHWKWPPPIEQVWSYDLRLRTVDTPETEVRMRDGALIVGCYAFWRIEDPLHFSVRLRTTREAENQVRARINEARDRVLGQYSITDLFNLDSEVVFERFDEIERRIQAAVSEGVKTDFGVAIDHVGIRRVTLPSDATAKALEAMKKERESLAAQFRGEGLAKKTEIEGRAEAERKQILDFIERRASEIVSEGTLATERIIARIRDTDAPFFIWLRKLEALQAALKEGTTIFIESEGELFEAFRTPIEPTGERRSDEVFPLSVTE